MSVVRAVQAGETMKRRKFIEWCGAALAALVVPWRKAEAEHNPFMPDGWDSGHFVVLSHSADELLITGFDESFNEREEIVPIAATITSAPRALTVTTHIPQESIDKMNAFMEEARANGDFKPIVLDDVIHHSIDKPPKSLGPHRLKRYAGKEIGVYNPGSLQDAYDSDNVVHIQVVLQEPADFIALSMKTAEQMEASIPLCKNCGGHFTRDHTHIFHGEDICDKWMDPLTGRWSKYSRYEAQR